MSQEKPAGTNFEEQSMSVPYNLFYRLGFHPWEDLAEHPPFAEKLSELLDREESSRTPPYGPALDLGCGSAVWGVKLAERGWQVTGIDIVEKALQRGRERVQEAGVDMRLVQGDVTDLGAADIGSDFRLVLDTGTFHGLGDAQRPAMGREISAVAADDATVLLDVFAPRRRGPLPRGASRSEVETAFPGWKLTDVEVADSEPDALAKLLKFDEHWYRLRRQ
jgi:SAM-dependent methyltransferase